MMKCCMIFTFSFPVILRKYYLPHSFLVLAADNPPFQRLYQQMLLDLEPMAHLPFDLSINFEAKQVFFRRERERERGRGRGRGSRGLVSLLLHAG